MDLNRKKKPKVIWKMKRYQSIVIAVLIAELIVTDAAVLAGSSRNKGKERVMHEGPKVLIKSTSLKSNIVGRHKNSDLHEIYLAPYRYVSCWRTILFKIFLKNCQNDAPK